MFKMRQSFFIVQKLKATNLIARSCSLRKKQKGRNLPVTPFSARPMSYSPLAALEPHIMALPQVPLEPHMMALLHMSENPEEFDEPHIMALPQSPEDPHMIADPLVEVEPHMI